MYIFFVIAVLISFLGWAIWRQNMNRETLSWSSVEGVIISHSAEVDNDVYSDDSGDNDSFFVAILVTVFLLVSSWFIARITKPFRTKPITITYRYTVSGQNYESKRFSYGRCQFNDREWSNVMNQYPIGSRFPVYFNPSKPDCAVINRQSTSIWQHIITSDIFVMFVVFFVVIPTLLIYIILPPLFNALGTLFFGIISSVIERFQAL